ncbi:MAG: M4 family metallopeptidase [Bacteroidota bacterium]
MKNQVIFIVLLSLYSYPFSLTAQTKSTAKTHQQEQNAFVEWQNHDLKVDRFFEEVGTQLGIDPHSTFQLDRKIKGRNDFNHYKFQQYYKSIPVFGAIYILHEAEQQVVWSSGYFLPFLNLETQPALSREAALALAQMEMGAQKYSWEVEQTSLTTDATPTVELCIIDPAFPKHSEQSVLAYKVELTSVAPFDRKQFFIDAQRGTILTQFPLILEHAVPAKGVCRYYGEQSFVVDSIAPNQFHLHDPTRGAGIFTYMRNLDHVVTHDHNYWDLTNSAMDEVAVDAHFCASQFYDYMLETHNWEGLGNEGEPLLSIVHGGQYVNAFWNGTYALFGDGNCNNGPLTTLEVVAHEFTHGLTDHTSDLIYSGESGAINESLSDIFGKALEHRVDPDNFDWTIGHSFLETEYALPFRSFEDPNIFEHPKFYKGHLWTDGAGVHTNSSVGNHWFYSLVTGGSGTNEAGQNYNIEPLGMDKAMELVFLLQTAYLTANSDYPFMYQSSKLAATELFGSGAPEIASITEAWKKVGLPYTAPGGLLDLSIEFSAFVDYTCLNHQYYDFSVTISNLGGMAYLPWMNGRFELDGGDYEQQLNSPIMPGEKVVFEIADYIFVHENGTVNSNADLIIDGEEALDNNDDFMLIVNALYASHELELYSASISEANCFDELRNLVCRVENNSCGILPAGAVFDLHLVHEIEPFEWQGSFTIPNDLHPRARYQLEAPIDIPHSLSGSLHLQMNYDPDNDLTNNDRNLHIDELKSTLDAPYHMDFSFNNVLADPYLRLTGTPVKEYNGESYFAAAGIFPEFSANLCPDGAENFTSFARNHFEICAHFEGKYVMDFDLMQFRNPESASVPELSDFTTMAKVTYVDANTGQQDERIIYGQTEAELVHHQMELPLDFQGIIQFEFINISGTFEEAEYFEYDVNLLDNLQFSEVVVSTEDLTSTSLSIFPNPATDEINILKLEEATSLVLRDIHGKEVQKMPVGASEEKMDLGPLANGYYLLTVEYKNRAPISQPVVKMGGW